jgi:protein-S-isoprenylcysteine O-methyltransferase Ste14
VDRKSALLISAIFAVIAPGTVAGVLPWLISRWKWHDPFLNFYGFRIIGVLLIVLGLPVLLDSFVRFAIRGLGTPAPIFPTRHLVISGLYRYVRNPMYVAVLSLIIGQALLFGNVQLLLYAAIVFFFFHSFVLLYEEPKLRRTFGEEYIAFCANVPRWLPRFTPWKAAS